MDYIKLSRNILEWEWYADINTCRLFVHMLLKANWKEGNFRGTTVPRGSFVSSIAKLAEETQLTPDEVRTAIKHLIKTHELTKQSYSKYTVFTIKNYAMYQNVPSNSTSNSHSIPKLFPTIEEKKEGKKERNTPPISPVRRFEEFATAYPRVCTGYLPESEYCRAVASGVPEDDLVQSARNYADVCRREKTAERYIKKPENFLRENLFMQYLKGEDNGSTGRNTGTHEKSLNEILSERGYDGEFEGF